MKNMKKATPVIETCEKVSKISIYALAFLLPILFLPWTANVLDFNKQALLVVLVFVSLFAWMLKTLVSGRAKFNLSLVHVPVLALFSIYTISTVFSSWRYGSFWGWPQVSSESLLTLLGLTVLYFLVVNIFERKEIFYLILSLSFSGFLALLYGALQLFGKFVIPIGFTKAVFFNTIGGINNLAIFAAVLLPLVIVLLTISKQRNLKIFFIATIAISAILLLAINFQIAWWIVIAGSALIIIFGMQKRNDFDARWLVLPMFFLALALLFSFFRFQIPGTPERPAEFFLTNSASFNIVKQELKSSPVIGSGPGTFKYSFSQFKDVEFNQTSLWDTRFEWGSSKIITILGTVGVLGLLGFLALMAFFVFYGIRFLFSPHKKDEDDINPEFFWSLGLGIFITFLTISVLFFFYQSNLSLDFVYFLLIACLVALFHPVKKDIVLKPSSLITLGITFSFTLIFIFCLGIIILEGQRYVAAMNYLDSMAHTQKGEMLETIDNLQTAVRINPKVDLYRREIAKAYIRIINETKTRTDISSVEAGQLIQVYINNAVNAAKIATEINPKDVVNWSARGAIYQSLVGVVGGTKNWAVDAYNQASKLEPTNPFFPTQIGVTLLKEASNNGGEKELLVEAEGYFKKAIELKSDYASAYFQLAVIYQAQGKQAEMLQKLKTASSMAPFDVGLSFQLGLIYFQLGYFAEARVELERAVALKPDYANALYYLGIAYDELEETANAIAAFEKIRLSNPDNSLVKTILNNLRSGQRALEGIVEEEPPVVPIDESGE